MVTSILLNPIAKLKHLSGRSTLSTFRSQQLATSATSACVHSRKCEPVDSAQRLNAITKQIKTKNSVVRSIWQLSG